MDSQRNTDKKTINIDFVNERGASIRAWQAEMIRQISAGRDLVFISKSGLVRTVVTLIGAMIITTEWRPENINEKLPKWLWDTLLLAFLWQTDQSIGSALTGFFSRCTDMARSLRTRDANSLKTTQEPANEGVKKGPVFWHQCIGKCKDTMPKIAMEKTMDWLLQHQQPMECRSAPPSIHRTQIRINQSMEERLKTLIDQQATPEGATPTEEAEFDQIQLAWQKITTGECITTLDHTPLLGLCSKNSWGTVDIIRVNQWVNQLNKTPQGKEAMEGTSSTGTPEKLIGIIIAQAAKRSPLWSAVGTRWITNALTSSKLDFKKPISFIAEYLSDAMTTPAFWINVMSLNVNAGSFRKPAEDPSEVIGQWLTFVRTNTKEQDKRYSGYNIEKVHINLPLLLIRAIIDHLKTEEVGSVTCVDRGSNAVAKPAQSFPGLGIQDSEHADKYKELRGQSAWTIG